MVLLRYYLNTTKLLSLLINALIFKKPELKGRKAK
jgi:hypothetical protein